MAESEQVAEVRALVSNEPPTPGEKTSASAWLQRLCRAAAKSLPATGVGVSMLSHEGELMTAAASSPAMTLVDELQFTMGEGPCLLAFASRAPVLVPDLGGAGVGLWPGYAPAAQERGVHAVFAFPLQVGTARLGALDVYRDRAGQLSSAAQAQAQVFADVAMERLLQASASSDGVDALLDDPVGSRFEVYQAQGMVMIQLQVESDEALVRLRAHAFAEGRSLVDVAQDVIARRLLLERDDEG